MQLYNGDVVGVSQQTVSKVITETVYALCAPHILNRFIRFLANHHLPEIKAEFREFVGFPDIIGAIEGSH